MGTTCCVKGRYIKNNQEQNAINDAASLSNIKTANSPNALKAPEVNTEILFLEQAKNLISANPEVNVRILKEFRLLMLGADHISIR